MKITTSKVIDATLAKYNMTNGYDPARLNWEWIQSRELEWGGDGVLDLSVLQSKIIQLRPEWFSVLAYLDYIDLAFAGKLSATLHSLNGGSHSCHFGESQVNVSSSAGRTLATIQFSTGEWITMIAGESEKNNFCFQGCYFEGGKDDVTLNEVLTQIRSFAECATVEAFLPDMSLAFC